MIVDLVLYLLRYKELSASFRILKLTFCRQGSYSSEGDIVVLCAYLGQLAKLRDALAGKIAVVLDERDQQELAMREEENDSDTHSPLQHVKVSQRVRALNSILYSCLVYLWYRRFDYAQLITIKGSKHESSFYP
jgi:hypothetical protein